MFIFIYYFVPTILYSEDLFRQGTISDFEIKWYSKHLKAMNELPVYSASSDCTVFRLLVVPTWSPAYVIRIEHVNEQVTMRYVELDGQGGYEPGKVNTDHTEEKSIELFNSLSKKVDQSGFWQEPTKGDEVGFDGTQYVLEGVKKGKYHVISRWEKGSGKIVGLFNYILDINKTIS